jgi:N-acyl homoserine lactone hydrolase
MNVPASITITPVLVADLLAEGERMPVYVHVIDHPDARVLVDTGIRSCTRRWPTSIPASVH